MPIPLPKHKVNIPNPEKKRRIRRTEKEVTRLQRLSLPYVFGGGRNCGYPPCADGPGDCSWLAGHLCNVLGFQLPFPATGLNTYSLATVGEAGHGKYFTMYIKNPPDPHDAHVIVELRGRFAECGGSDNPQSLGGTSWVTPGKGMGLTVHQRLAEFPIRRHFKGF